MARKKLKKVREQARKAMLNLRGGYTGQGTYGNLVRMGRNYLTSEVKKGYGNLKPVLVREGTKRFGAIGGYAVKGLTEAGEKFIREKIQAVHPESMTVGESSGEPTMDIATGSRKTSVDYQGPVKSRTFVENYNMGEKTSKSLLNAASQNGSKTLCVFDSMNDSNFKDPSNAHREYLELVTGFNQKLLYSNLYMTGRWVDIYEKIYKVGFSAQTTSNLYPNPNSQIKTVDYRIYAGAISYTNKLRFRNNMSTTSCKIKVHIIGCKTIYNATSLNYYAPITNATWGAGTAEGTTQGMDLNKVIAVTAKYTRPNYQSNAGVWEANTTSNTFADAAYVTPSALMSDSPVFNERYKIVKTFSKTLDVGDELLLNLKTTFGSGLRLDRALALYDEVAGSTQVSSSTWAFPYMMVVELLGPSVTAETTNAAHFEDKFVGTSPCSVNMEVKQYFTYALESNSGVPTANYADLSETDFGARIGQPLVRYFIKDEVVSSTPYNVSYWNSTQSSTPSIKIKSATTANIADVKTTI